MNEVEPYCGLFLCLSFQIYVISNQRLPTAVLQRREDLYKKRLTEAYYLFIYLELAQRYHIKNYQRIEGDVDSMILKHKSLMQTCFNESWAVKHRCEVEGCGWCITIDGGLKPHRMLCGAKLSGISGTLGQNQNTV